MRLFSALFKKSGEMEENHHDDNSRSASAAAAGGPAAGSAAATDRKEDKEQDKKTAPTYKIAKPQGRQKKKRKHRPEEYPKRPLSAYNIFFKETRAKLLAKKESGKEEEEDDGISAEDKSSMVRHVASLWKTANPAERTRVEAMAKADLQRYKDEVKAYEEAMVIRNQKERKEAKRAKMVDREKKVREAAASVAGGVASENAAAYWSRGGQGGYLHGDSRGIRSDRHDGQLASSNRPLVRDGGRISENDLDRLVAEEISALDLAHNLKLQQMQLTRDAYRSDRRKLFDSLDTKRKSLGLSPLVPTPSVSAAAARIPPSSAAATAPPTSSTAAARAGGLHEIELLRSMRAANTDMPPSVAGSSLGLSSQFRSSTTNTVENGIAQHAAARQGRDYSHQLRPPSTAELSRQYDALQNRRDELVREEALMRHSPASAAHIAAQYDALQHRREAGLREEALMRLRLREAEQLALERQSHLGLLNPMHPHDAAAAAATGMSDLQQYHRNILLGGGGMNYSSGAAGVVGGAPILDGLSSHGIGAAGMYGRTAMTGLGSHLLGRSLPATTTSSGGAPARYHSRDDEAVHDDENSARGRTRRLQR